MSPVPPAAPPPAESTIRVAPLLWRMAGVLALLAGGGLLLVKMFEASLAAWGAWFVAKLGPWGVALAFLIPDMTGLPIPPELATGLALAGGMSFWVVVVAGAAGSIAGGCLAYVGSQLLRRIPFIHAKIEARAAEVHVLIDRYGVLALVLGALTPLPYSLVAWACGVLGMDFRTFILVSLLRIPRVAIYLLPMWWSLQQGTHP